MSVRRPDGRETWSRLLNWDKGQTASERMAAILLSSDRYEQVDPSHPLGGKDGGKDGLLQKDGLKMVWGVYFPRGQQTFSQIKSKFVEDFAGVAKNKADGFIFFTNQEIRLAERSELQNMSQPVPVDIYHIERISTLLNTPSHYGTRLEFLSIDMTQEELVALYKRRDSDYLNQLKEIESRLEQATNLITGGDSYCEVLLSYPHPHRDRLTMLFFNKGSYPIYDLSVSIRDIDAEMEMLRNTRTLPNPVSFRIGTLAVGVGHSGMALPYDLNKYGDVRRFWFSLSARNGVYDQRWAVHKGGGMATILTRNGEVLIESVNDNFPRKADGGWW